MSSLTRLGLYGGVEEAAAACAVTGLRHLCLYNRPNDDAILPGTRLRVLPSSLSSLQRLSHLSISWCRHLEELPADLGMWLPELEVLEAKGCRFETVPASLTALQHLDVSDSTAQRLTLPAALSGLRDLNLHGARQLTSLSGLGELAALEALDIRSTKIFRRGWDLGPGSLTSLQPLTGLRRLAFTREVFRNDPGLNPASYTVLATLTLLTHLTVGPVTLRTKADALLIRRWRGGIDRDAGLQALASMPPLPHLQELVIGEYVGYNAMAALGPWVAKLTALTQLDLWGNQLGKSGTRQLRRLPVQLRELDLSRTGLEEPPVCLTRLTALEVLHIGREGRLVDLARWRAQSSGSTWWLREG
jgi:Leucine-rich repeat (LRR) protein